MSVPVAGDLIGEKTTIDGIPLAAHSPPIQLPNAGKQTPAHVVDFVRVTPNGGVMILGWANDLSDPIDFVQVTGTDWSALFKGSNLARVRRGDVESVLGASAAHSYGYLALIYGGKPITPDSPCKVDVVFASKAAASHVAEPLLLNDEELRDHFLTDLRCSDYFGNPLINGILGLARGSGDQILRLNNAIISNFLTAPYVERFGRQDKSYRGSIVVCLFGELKYLFLQAALFSAKPGIDDYEFIYVCNSPELSEPLLKEAKLAARIYDVSITIVALSGNAGFASANNLAVQFARTDRILFVNPDVFPREDDWALKHSLLLGNLPVQKIKIFGVPLYYDNGSLMHGGMYLEVDTGVVFERGKSTAWNLLRVEHYGKGAPGQSTRFNRSRPVPAVSGAFISIDRGWFETLNGFSTDYVFGHYEDADLCLKSLAGGTVAWLHDLRLWHLEGKGSTRLPVHDGGSMVNRWIFSTRWGELVSRSLSGDAPWGTVSTQAASSLKPINEISRAFYSGSSGL